MQRAALKRDPDKLREWKRKSAERQWEHQKKINANHRDAPSFKQRKPLKKQSKARAREMQRYYQIRTDYLARFPACMICAALGETPAAATEIHHRFGRSNSLLCDERGFCSSCRAHREWPHENPIKARELGILGEARYWGVPIDRHKK